MAQKIIKVRDIEIANDKPFVLFGGINVLCLLYTSRCV